MTDNLQYSGVPSGFPSLDKITGGWQPSDLIVVAAHPYVGKTSFALTVARNAAVDYRIPVAFFSLETTAVQLAKRMMVSESVIAKHKNGECADVPLKFLPSELRFVMPPCRTPDLMHKDFDKQGYKMIIEEMLPDIADGLTSRQRTLLNTVKLLTDADMLNAPGIVWTAYVVGCAINRRIDVDVPYAEIVDYATKHPLGDVCYDEIIRLAAEWRLPYPMLGYHGNFGSLQGDCPAHMLYTSINLSDFAKDVVEPYDNLDNKKIACQEFSRVLPYKIPILLVNGYVNEPYILFVPHNIAEVCDAVLVYLVNPKISIRRLMTYIKGPDFPTGGMIETKELRKIYRNGYGYVDIYADVSVDESPYCNDDGICLHFSTPYMADFYEIKKELDFIVATNSIIGVKEAHYSYKNSLNQGFAVVVDKSSNLSATIKEIYDKTPLLSRLN